MKLGHELLMGDWVRNRIVALWWSQAKLQVLWKPAWRAVNILDISQQAIENRWEKAAQVGDAVWQTEKDHSVFVSEDKHRAENYPSTMISGRIRTQKNISQLKDAQVQEEENRWDAVRWGGGTGWGRGEVTKVESEGEKRQKRVFQQQIQVVQTECYLTMKSLLFLLNIISEHRLSKKFRG